MTDLQSGVGSIAKSAAKMAVGGEVVFAARLPSVESVLADASSAPLIEKYGRTQTLAALRALLAELRAEIVLGTASAATEGDNAAANRMPLHDGENTFASLTAVVAERLAATAVSSLKQLFNLTGTVLHTNMGRALLPDVAIRAVVEALSSPMNLEFDLATGKRGDRDDLVEGLLCELTGAEAATVVNNNAAAVLLMLSALAPRREVIVSRGELVEIGGSFRIPDIMMRAGAKLHEVGTTNRTHLSDYAEAIGSRSALLMKVHCSNYAIQGFTKSVEVAQLAELTKAHGVPTVVDLGSGTLVDLSQYGLPHETTVRETIAAGADLVTFSGDKLLGGPQAGLIVGRADLIKKIKRHPLKRALRVGKLTLAALEPVLALYRSPEFLPERLTTVRLLTRPQSAMRLQAENLMPIVQRALGPTVVVTAEPLFSQIGSGALPVDLLPSYGLSLRINAPQRRGRGLGKIEKMLRNLPRPVIGRITNDTLLLDLRCLEHADEAQFISQLSTLTS